jgi:hypothetical protein
VIKFVSRLNLSGSRVDREKGIIKSVSLIALGEARGHDKSVDGKTLETVVKCAKEYKEGLRVRFNPKTFSHGAGGLAGFIPVDTITVNKDGDKAIGDLHVYNSMPAEDKEYLYEIVERTPNNIGLSIEFSGDDETIDGNNFARCSEIFAATIVDLPAANRGFFSAEENNRNANSEKDTSMTEEQLKALTATITSSLQSGFKEIKQMFQGFPPPPKAAPKPEDEKAAGVTAEDDDETKQKKMAAYAASQSKPVSEMTASELGAAIARGNMQFFKQTGGHPAKPTVENDNKGLDPFEQRVETHLAAGARGRGVAIMRARRDAPQEYNAWRAKQNPNVQNMQQK